MQRKFQYIQEQIISVHKLFINNYNMKRVFLDVIPYYLFLGFFFSQFVICIFFLCSCAVSVICLMVVVQHTNNKELNRIMYSTAICR